VSVALYLDDAPFEGSGGVWWMVEGRCRGEQAVLCPWSYVLYRAVVLTPARFDPFVFSSTLLRRRGKSLSVSGDFTYLHVFTGRATSTTRDLNTGLVTVQAAVASTSRDRYRLAPRRDVGNGAPDPGSPCGGCDPSQKAGDPGRPRGNGREGQQAPGAFAFSASATAAAKFRTDLQRLRCEQRSR